MDVFLEVDGAVLTPGQDTALPPTPLFGYGGNVPRNSASGDGFAYYAADIANAGGLAAVFTSTGFAPTPIDLGPTFGGAILINPAVIIQIGGGSLSSTFGELIQVVAPSGSINTLTGSLTFQGATLGGAGLRLTNATKVTFG
jgi:hypothetical protein